MLPGMQQMMGGIAFASGTAGQPCGPAHLHTCAAGFVFLSITDAVDIGLIAPQLCSSGAALTLRLPAAAASSLTTMHTRGTCWRAKSLQLPLTCAVIQWRAKAGCADVP